MEVGRKYDALVAEKLFGWTDIQHGPGCSCCDDTWEEWTGLPPLKEGDDGKRFIPHPRCSQCGSDPSGKWQETRIATERRKSIPEFTTDIRATHLVIDKVKSRVIDILYHPDASAWSVEIGDTNTTGENMLETICRAALRTVGVLS